MEVAGATSDPPGQYAEHPGAQYSDNAYDFSADANQYIAIDQNLDSSPSFHATDVRSSEAHLANHVAIHDQNGHQHIITQQADPQTQGDNITTPTTPLNPGKKKRKSQEDISETGPAVGDSKRKRSKVSRACDQCRKKKIRCDADSEGTNQLKTCSNCQKSGQICDYSRIPQKRGPSKGYIKELSERVQQVEGQLARQNSTGYRSSFDEQRGSFSEPPFSPDDDSAVRNHSSFSQQRSPFADFSRDRFPSIGGWNSRPITSNPRHPSIAIPPDQTSPIQDKLLSSSVLKPFWVEWAASPAKQSNNTGEARRSFEAEKMLFEPYYEIVHPLCPVLPDSGLPTANAIFDNASQNFGKALIIALRLIPQKRDTPSDDDQAWLEKFVNDETRQPLSSRSTEDSLLLLWTCLIMFVVVQHNTEIWTKPTLPECDLLSMSITICDRHFQDKPFLAEVNQYDAEWTRSAQITTMLSRLYAISKGESNDPMPSHLAPYINTNTDTLPPRVTFMALMSDTLQASLSLLPHNGVSAIAGTSIDFSRFMSANIRANLNLVGMTWDDPIARQVKAFSDLISMRANTMRFPKPTAVGPVLNLAEAIRMSTVTEAEDSSGAYIYNPLALHTNTLTTMTLLELQQCDWDDPTTGALIDQAVEDMRKCLVNLQERMRATACDPTKGRFWAGVLLELVEERRNAANPNLISNGRGEVLIVDLAALLQRGYANALLDYACKKR